MSDSATTTTTTKAQADRIKEIKAELAQLEAATSKPRKSKGDRQKQEASALLETLGAEELAFCKGMGSKKLELNSKAKLASGAKVQAAGLAMIFGDEKGVLWAKPSTYWYGVAMGDLK